MKKNVYGILKHKHTQPKLLKVENWPELVGGGHWRLRSKIGLQRLSKVAVRGWLTVVAEGSAYIKLGRKKKGQPISLNNVYYSNSWNIFKLMKKDVGRQIS